MSHIEMIRAEIDAVVLRHMHAYPADTLSAAIDVLVRLLAAVKGDEIRAQLLAEILRNLPTAVERARMTALGRIAPGGHA